MSCGPQPLPRPLLQPGEETDLLGDALSDAESGTMRNPGESFETDISLVVKMPNFQLLTVYYSK